MSLCLALKTRINNTTGLDEFPVPFRGDPSIKIPRKGEKEEKKPRENYIAICLIICDKKSGKHLKGNVIFVLSSLFISSLFLV